MIGDLKGGTATKMSGCGSMQRCDAVFWRLFVVANLFVLVVVACRKDKGGGQGGGNEHVHLPTVYVLGFVLG